MSTLMMVTWNGGSVGSVEQAEIFTDIMQFLQVNSRIWLYITTHTYTEYIGLFTLAPESRSDANWIWSVLLNEWIQLWLELNSNQIINQIIMHRQKSGSPEQTRTEVWEWLLDRLQLRRKCLSLCAGPTFWISWRRIMDLLFPSLCTVQIVIRSLLLSSHFLPLPSLPFAVQHTRMYSYMENISKH